jgi:hypothetical protein
MESPRASGGDRGGSRICRRVATALGCLLARGRGTRGALLTAASRTAHKLCIAIGADAVQRVGAGRAERAFVAADKRAIFVGRQRPRAPLASLAHLESHIRPLLSQLNCHRCYFVSLNSSRPISIRLISEVPAPISYSFASRHRRPVAYSLMYPLPPSA